MKPKPIWEYEFEEDGWVFQISWDPDKRPMPWTVADEFWRQKRIHKEKLKVKGLRLLKKKENE